MKKNKWNYVAANKMIIIGFLGLYVFCMLLTTYLTKENYRKGIPDKIGTILANVRNQIEDKDFIVDENGDFTPNGINYMRNVLTKETLNTGKNCMISIGILDSEGKLLAQTEDSIFTKILDNTLGPDEYHVIEMEKYFSDDELEEIMSYCEKNAGSDKEYQCAYYYDYEEEELVLFYIHLVEWRDKTKDGATLTYTTAVTLDTVFEWRNTEYLSTFKNKREFYNDKTSLGYKVYFPYLSYGKEYWETWKNDGFLHDFQEGFANTELAMVSYAEEPFGKVKNSYFDPIEFRNLPIEKNNEYCMTTMADYIYKDSYRIQVNVSAKPWLAAIEELTDVYIYAACFMAVCIAIVLYYSDKIYKKQVQLEERRRDFTNAIAHELKTPLAVVRGLAENIEIEESADMRDDFTRAIVNQTELMDELVKEMLFISKMDSDNLILKKEKLSVMELLEGQMSKLEHLIEGKNIQVEYWKEDEFLIEGDKSYLEKAVFNLLENAVSYNRVDGRISIKIEKNACSIENTADPIPEENLEHVCDMFFTGNESRSTDAKHKGLGLYLAKRIFDMHGIGLKIENTDIGVRVEFRSEVGK